MKQINVETATREQLIDFIRRMHSQLLREQERVKDLESQVTGFQAFIHEKNAEIRELRQQSDRLTEKSASDEETIGALIKQMEEMRREQPPPVGVLSATAPNAPRGKPVEQGVGRHVVAGDGAGGDRTPEALRPADGQGGGGDAHRRPSRTPPPHRESSENAVAQLKAQNATAASTIASKTEEIAVLQNKVRELMEVNAFYSAIVAQHDQEEKARMGQQLARGSGRPEDDAVELQRELEELRFHMSRLELQDEKLQRVIKGIEAEKAALKEENESLRRDSVLLEAEMEEMTREYTRARRSLSKAVLRTSAAADARLSYADADAPLSRAVSAPQHSAKHDLSNRLASSPSEAFASPLERRTSSVPSAAASRVSPLSHDGRPGASAANGASAAPSAGSAAVSRSRFNFRSLRPIRVRNPDAHEKDLLDRIHLYEEQFAQMERFEADRQRSFDEMERNRAEMFVAMNGQLERQRREIHRLRKLHEDASCDSSLTARPSQSHSVASVINREEEDLRAGLRRHGSHSPVERCLTAVPTSVQSLHNVDSLGAVDEMTATANASLNERDGATTHSAHQRRFHTTAPALAAAEAHKALLLEEAAARLRVWVDALEDRAALLTESHAVLAYYYSNEIVACSSKMLSEREALTAELVALQQRGDELEEHVLRGGTQPRVVGATVEPHVREVAKAKAQAVETCAEENNQEMQLLEQKALCTAYLAVDAYQYALEHCAAFFRAVSTGDTSTSVQGGDGCDDEGVASDLAEALAVLESLKVAAQHFSAEKRTPPQPQDDVRVDNSAPLHRGAAPGESWAPQQNSFDADGTQPIRSSSFSAEAAPLVEPPRAGDECESHASRSSAHHLEALADTDGVHEPSTQPDCNDRMDSDAFVSQDKSRNGTPIHHAAPSFQSALSYERDAAMLSDNCTVTTEGNDADRDVRDAGCTQLCVDEANDTATSQFADCAENDEETSRGSSVTPTGEAAKEDKGSAEEPGALSGTEADPAAHDSMGRGGAAGEVTSEASVDDFASLVSDEAAGTHEATMPPAPAAQEQAPDNACDASDAGHRGDFQELESGDVELCDSSDDDTIDADAPLDVTEAEEAAFLAQLQLEMEKDTLREMATTDADEGHVAAAAKESRSPSDEDVAEGVPSEGSSVGNGECEEEEMEEEEGTQPSAGSPQAASSRDSAAGESPEDRPFHTEAVKSDAETSSPSEPSEEEDDDSEHCTSSRDDAPSRGKGQNLSDHEVSSAVAVSPVSLISPSSASVSATAAVQHLDKDQPVQRPRIAVIAYSPPTIPPGQVALSLPEMPLDEAAQPVAPPAVTSGAFPSAAPPQPVADAPAPSPLPDPYKPASPFASFGYGAPIPTLSPNSMFATPPRPAPTRAFFTQSPGEDRLLPSPADPRTARAAESSSSEDDFEAGFDPFA